MVLNDYKVRKVVKEGRLYFCSLYFLIISRYTFLCILPLIVPVILIVTNVFRYMSVKWFLSYDIIIRIRILWQSTSFIDNGTCDKRYLVLKPACPRQPDPTNVDKRYDARTITPTHAAYADSELFHRTAPIRTNHYDLVSTNDET